MSPRISLTFAAPGFAFAPFAALVVAMIVTGYFGPRLGARLLSVMPERAFRIGLNALITLMALDMTRRAVST